MNINLNGNTTQNLNIGNGQLSGQTGQVNGTVQQQTGQVNGTVQQQTGGQVVASLANLMPGDAFNGEVTMLDGSNVTLTLPDGSLVNAAMKGDVNILPGQNLTFVVQSNEGNTVTLKSMQQISDQTAYVASKALEAAGLAESPSNVEMVQELLNNNMAINSQTLNDMAKACIRYPDASLDTLARMQKLEIPVTQENIEQFEAYKSYENRLSGDIMNMTDGLNNLISSQSSQGGAAVADMSNRILDILYNTGVNDEQSATPEPKAASDGGQVSNETVGNPENVTPENESNVSSQSEIAGEPISSFINAQDREELSQLLNDALNGQLPKEISQALANGDISAREALEMINEMLKSDETEPAALQNMLDSKGYSGLMGMVVRDTMHLSPGEVKDKKNIKDFYSKILKTTDELNKLAKEKEADNPALAKSLSGVKDNVEFMNELNKNLTYMQMPIKFSEGNGDGELYVFTNKKSLKQNKDEVSALLHLDMDNLGPVDVFVKLKDKNVTTNFCLESEEMLDFVNEHIDQLNERLVALGYNCKFEMKVKDGVGEHKDFVEDFLNAGMPKAGMSSQLVFDRKV